MKISITELRSIVGDIVAEAKKSKKTKTKRKSKEKDPEPRAAVQPAGYSKDFSHDFSPPLGHRNALRLQGAANFGPWTDAPSSGDGDEEDTDLDETLVRPSAWRIFESRRSPKGVWESLSHKIGRGAR